MTLKIVKIKIGDIRYQESSDQKVWLHLMFKGHEPYIYATVAPDYQMALALAQLQGGEVWSTFPMQDVMAALKNAEQSDSLEINIDSGTPPM